MDEEPHAHETLVAKIGPRDDESGGRQADISSSSSSKSSKASSLHEAESQNEDTLPLGLTPINVVPNAKLSIYLLEPLILILLFAYNFSSTVLANQIIYQTCTAAFGYADEKCLLLGSKNATNETKLIEAEVQPYAARVFLTMKLLECIVPALFGLFVGAWADRYGRKPLLMASYLGYALQYLLSACIAQWARQNHGQVSPWYYILTIIPLSCLGNSITYSVAAVCFIGDVAVGKMRSYRMIAYELSIYIGLMIGAYTSGYVYEATNNAYLIFIISAGAILFAQLIMFFWLPESLPAAAQLSSAAATATTTTTTTGATYWQLLKDLWQSCARPRELRNRSIIILLMLTLLLTAFVNDGANSVFYLFMRERFHWTVRQFTSYESVSILVPAVAGSGGILFLWSLRQCSKSAILWLALISLMSHMSSSLMKAFAFVDWQIYLAIGLGVFKSLVNPMCRTAITNLLPADERGKIFSMLSVLQSLTPFASSTLYIVIYSITLSSYPGAFNFISANLFGLAAIFLLVIWRKKSTSHAYYEPIFK